LVLDLEDFRNAETVIDSWIRKSEFKRIAAVFAAAILGPQGPLIGCSLTDWDRTFRVNVLGNLAVARAILPVQRENRFGRLLFFAGGGAAYAYPVFPAYAATKSALVRIVENLHQDLKDEGDFATAILAPGAVQTDTLAMVRASGAEIRTTVPIAEPVAFAREFILSQYCAFSGCFVHVRDEWRQYLRPETELPKKDLWKLRRVE
jgi:NAD(P)-dependent dehydrogenase (short-subunit alcohol dehydrogenase family)